MINYIILAHKNPEQLNQLVNKLDNNDVNFYIHIDKSVSIDTFTNLFNLRTNIHFIKEENRELGTWCDIAIVKATINSLKEIIKDNKKGYCCLISGQDYPIKNNQYIHEFFTKNDGKEFIEIFKLPTENWFEKGMNRLTQYKFNLSNRRGHFVVCPTIYNSSFYKIKTLKSILKLINAGKLIYILKLFKKRKIPTYIQHYGGSQWWCLKIETVKKILNFIQENPDYLAYHEFSLLPDEMFFQSIIMKLNSNNTELIMDSLTFVDWEQKDAVSAPTYSINDFDNLINQPYNKLFARKFDFEYDFEIIKKLDEFIK